MARISTLVSCISFIGFCLAVRRIDTHIHALPPAYLEAVLEAGGDPSGYPTPDWSPQGALSSMNSVGTDIVSSPGVPILGIGQQALNLTRSLNYYLGNLTQEKSSGRRFGFFGVLPDLQDIEGTLNEIDFLYSEQRLCHGVTMYTTYGGLLLGDPMFQPVWAKLQKYKALVFIHPAVLDVEPHFISSGLPQPVVDYPLATTRTAVDLVFTGTLKACPDVDIILSHAGGTIPYLAERAIGSLAIPEIAATAAVGVIQARKDFQRFYYDIALSTSDAQLDGLLDFADPSHILYGSDYPYAPQFAIDALLAQYALYVSTNTRGSEIAPGVLFQNAVTLLTKHSQGLALDL